VPSLDPRFLALIVSGLTSALALEHHGHMKSKETVLVTAAAGAAGQIAIQLAKMAGNHVVGTCSTGKETFLKSLGVDRVINYKTEDVQQVLKKEYPKGIDIVFESVGGKMFESCLKALAIKGRLIVIGAISSYAAKVKDGQPINAFNWDVVKTNQLLGKSITVTGFFLNHYSTEFPRTMKFLTDSVAKGHLKPAIHSDKFVGLKQISDALKCMHSGKNIGKVIVQISLSKSKL
jgi:prostaglandin reductase 3